MMVLRFSLINFPKGTPQDPKNPNCPSNRMSTLLFHLVNLGEIIELKVKIKGTVKSLHWKDYRMGLIRCYFKRTDVSQRMLCGTPYLQTVVE